NLELLVTPTSVISVRVIIFLPMTTYTAISGPHPGVMQLLDSLHPDAAHADKLQELLTASDVCSWAVSEGQKVVAVMGAQMKHVSPSDPEYTYSPPTVALISMSMWHVLPGHWGSVAEIWEKLKRQARTRGIDRLSIEFPLEYGQGV